MFNSIASLFLHPMTYPDISSPSSLIMQRGESPLLVDTAPLVFIFLDPVPLPHEQASRTQAAAPNQASTRRSLGVHPPLPSHILLCTTPYEASGETIKRLGNAPLCRSAPLNASTGCTAIKAVIYIRLFGCLARLIHTHRAWCTFDSCGRLRPYTFVIP